MQLLTDVSWKAAGYIGTGPMLSLSPLSCPPPTPQLLFFPSKKNILTREKPEGTTKSTRKTPLSQEKWQTLQGVKSPGSFAG